MEAGRQSGGLARVGGHELGLFTGLQLCETTALSGELRWRRSMSRDVSSLDSRENEAVSLSPDSNGGETGASAISPPNPKTLKAEHDENICCDTQGTVTDRRTACTAQRLVSAEVRCCTSFHWA